MIDVYTDGSSRHDGKKWIGAYAFAIYVNKKLQHEESNILIPLTNNGSELVAVMKALHYCQQHYPTKEIRIHTDSQYVLYGHARNKQHPLNTNRKLWKLYYKMRDHVNFTLSHVKAHASNKQNNHVDKLARTKLREYFKHA